MTVQYEELDFQNGQDAIAHLIDGKPDECRQKLIGYYHEGRGLGLDFNDAFDRASMLHHHVDHEFGMTPPEGFEVDNDPFAEAVLAEALDNNNVPQMKEETILLYRKYREWGMTIYYAGQSAISRAVTRANELEYNKLDREFYAEMDGVSHDAIEAYREARSKNLDPKSARVLADIALSKSLRGDE